MGLMTDTALIVGASRGLGFGLAEEYLKQGWRVIASCRSVKPPAALRDLATNCDGRLRVETVDIDFPEQVTALRDRLAGERIDLLFVVAGISNGAVETVPTVSTDAFSTMMVTNALSPIRVIEAFADLVPKDGVIAAMSSGLGSVANNLTGGWEGYRASKAALNTMLRSFSVRRGDGRTVLAVAPGWVRTDMGGPSAHLDIETSVTGMVTMIAARRGHPGSAYVDYRGNDVPW
jgi:NAD(P)-dependent dehydrogenase (short-subunit alcohol dehydrogenase family)